MVDTALLEARQQLFGPIYRIVPGAGDVVVDHDLGLEPVGIRRVSEAPSMGEPLTTVAPSVPEIAVLTLERRGIDVAAPRVDCADLQR